MVAATSFSFHFHLPYQSEGHPRPLTSVDFCHDSAKQASLMALAAPEVHRTFYLSRGREKFLSWGRRFIFGK